MTNTSPHILICCLDTVRKDYYDKYAPRLRSRADILFEEMRAAASWSVPSHAAMVTGKLPSEVGVHTYNRDFGSLALDETWLSNQLFADYRTVAISANVYAGPEFGFGTLFDEMVGISPASWFPDGMDVDKHIHDRTGDTAILEFVKATLQHDHTFQSLANGAILKALDMAKRLPVRRPVDYGGSRITKRIQSTLTTADSPTLCFANLMDAHGPHASFPGLDDSLYDAPVTWSSSSFVDWDVNVTAGIEGYESEVEYVRGLYGAEIDYLDRLLDDLFSTLETHLDRDLVVIVTSDHGENLGYQTDDYLLNHTSSLTEALLHVPFDIIKLGTEKDTDEPTVIEQYSSLLDLGQITTHLVRGEEVMNTTRKHPAAEILGSGAKIPGVDKAHWDRTIRAVYDASLGWKYLRDTCGTEIVKDVSGSPSKERTITGVEKFPDDLFSETFTDDIETAMAQAEQQDSTNIDETTKQRLKDLGYA